MIVPGDYDDYENGELVRRWIDLEQARSADLRTEAGRIAAILTRRIAEMGRSIGPDLIDQICESLSLAQTIDLLAALPRHYDQNCVLNAAMPFSLFSPDDMLAAIDRAEEGMGMIARSLSRPFGSPFQHARSIVLASGPARG